MTRQEFIEGVNSFGDLISFCVDEGIDDLCNDVYDAEYLNEILLETIGNMRDWEEIRGLLANIPTRCDYYREDGYGGYEDADYSFDDYKNEVLRHMDENEAWDEEEEMSKTILKKTPMKMPTTGLRLLTSRRILKRTAL